MKRILISLIGKPGSGKTTAGKALEKTLGAQYISYSDILKAVNPNPGPTGFSIEDRKRANELVKEKSSEYGVTIISWNPQPKIGFWFLNEITSFFDHVFVINFCINDDIALERLIRRNRDVLKHDGTSDNERLLKFNTTQLPLIEEQRRSTPIIDICVDDLTVDELALKIISIVEISV